MENQLSSSGIFSQDSHRLRFSERFRKIWRFDEKIQNNLREEFSSSQCSTTLIGQKNGNSLDRISKEVWDYAKRFQWGHRSFFGPGNEEKWYGQWSNGMTKHFAESGHPIFRGRSALNRRILRRKVGRNAIHFTAESVNIELFFARVTRQISSVSTEQYRVGVMSQLNRCLVRRPWEWTNPFQKWMISYRNSWIREKLVVSLVRNQTRTEEAPVNCWRGHLQRFKMLDLDEQFRTICESVGFMRP